MTAYALTRTHHPGGKCALNAIRLADSRAESPPESQVRVELHLAGLPPPAVQFDVIIGRGHIARLDLAYPEAKVGIEYDGLGHATYDQLARDRQRLRRLAAAGWIIYGITAIDLDRFPLVAREIGELLISRGCDVCAAARPP